MGRVSEPGDAYGRIARYSAKEQSEPPPKKKIRRIKSKEREGISKTLYKLLGDSDNFDALTISVQTRIDNGLDLSCFPTRKSFWLSIRESREFKQLLKAGCCV